MASISHQNVITDVSMKVDQSSMNIEDSSHEKQLPLSTDERKQKRFSYTIKDKVKAIRDFDNCKDYAEAAKRAGCSRVSVIDWVKQRHNLEASVQSNDTDKKRLEGCGKKLIDPQLDELLFNWILEQRRNSNSITY